MNDQYVLPPEITRELLGQIVDEVFDSAIEDVTVIENIYRVIAKYIDRKQLTEWWHGYVRCVYTFGGEDSDRARENIAWSKNKYFEERRKYSEKYDMKIEDV